MDENKQHKVYFGNDRELFFGPFRDAFTAFKFAVLEGAEEPYRIVPVS